MSARRYRYQLRYKKIGQSEVVVLCKNPRKVKKQVKELIDLRYPMTSSLEFEFVKIIDTKKCKDVEAKQV